MNGYTFTTILMALAIITLLIYAAMQGSLVAVAILATFATILLVSLGAVITLATQRMANDKAQVDFVNNAKENLAMMQAMQRIQNAQNQTIMSQLGRVTRLPEPQRGMDLNNALLIDDGLFSDLDD